MSKEAPHKPTSEFCLVAHYENGELTGQCQKCSCGVYVRFGELCLGYLKKIHDDRFVGWV